MADAVEEAVKVDWAKDAFWVQDTRMYLVREDDESSVIVVTAQDGTEKRIDRDSLTETHFLMHKTSVYKPLFRPVQAICLDEDTVIDLESGATCTVQSGDAVLRMADGTISVLDRHNFNCNYRIVSHGGPIAPDFPFAEAL